VHAVLALCRDRCWLVVAHRASGAPITVRTAPDPGTPAISGSLARRTPTLGATYVDPVTPV
jgi:hypothetical protein